MTTGTFFADLAFREKGKRKRAGSLPRTANCPPPPNNATVEDAVDEDSTQQKSDEDPHEAKKRRPNDPGDETPVDDSKAVANLDMSSIFDDLKLRSRVVPRKRGPVSPFIPRKPRGITKALVRRAPRPTRPTPVFGLASIMSADEHQLSIAVKVKGAQVTMVATLNDLPKVARDSAISQQEKSQEEISDAQVPVYYNGQLFKHNDVGAVVPDDDGAPQDTAYYDEQTTVDSEEQDVPSYDNGAVADDTQVQCVVCNNLCHPAHIGKGLQDPAHYLDNRRDQAMHDDAELYRKNPSFKFTCKDCDDEALATKQKWAPKELNAERRRRNKVFVVKHSLKKVEIHECDNCDQIILTTRFECVHCESICKHFDLCPECFSDPSISSMHQHSAGDMEMK